MLAVPAEIKIHRIMKDKDSLRILQWEIIFGTHLVRVKRKPMPWLHFHATSLKHVPCVSS